MPNVTKPKIQIKTPITYYGGKQTLCPFILKLMPEHYLYCEPFCGGGAVFFGKTPSPMEVINDHSCIVMTFYRVLKSNYSQLAQLVQQTLHSRALHAETFAILKNIDAHEDLKIARAFRVQTSQSYGSKLFGSFGYDRQKATTPRKIFFKKLKFTPDVSERLERVTLECDDALKIIPRYDSERTFFYLDPPYLNCDQWHYAGYTETDFIALLELLTKIKGKFLLSNYPSELLSGYMEKHKRRSLEIKKPLSVNHRARGKVATEVLVGNYDLAAVRTKVNLSETGAEEEVT